MGYFTWIAGIGVAPGFGVINAMWLEASGHGKGTPQGNAGKRRS
ncbi:cytochrome bd-I oxidase subunit CydX [Paraburkholderia dinghuensis]|uniref:Cytochrome bd-I oxidase subunit CydX n=1 Tax=Paraburkholderia dinghuensis TaxID=2305225 RepID=A0A3N6MW74_9BURK|nr:cytochrome bd-I oxidase subunit CydX [Paraburkholderia dinghuensis]